MERAKYFAKVQDCEEGQILAFVTVEDQDIVIKAVTYYEEMGEVSLKIGLSKYEFEEAVQILKDTDLTKMSKEIHSLIAGKNDSYEVESVMVTKELKVNEESWDDIEEDFEEYDQ